MTEAELLELFTMSRSAIAFLITQIVAIHFALVAGIYLFFRRTSLILRFALLTFYTGGYAALLGLYFWEQAAADGVGQMIAQLPEPSQAVRELMHWSREYGRPVILLSWAVFAGGWLMIAFALFSPIKAQDGPDATPTPPA